MKIATGSYNRILFAAIFAIMFSLFGLANVWFLALAAISWIATIFLLIFFRDPERKTGEGIVSPADGIVSRIDNPEPGYVRICIFMNVHNVHVNRAPISGKVLSVEHIDGKHIPAFDKDSDANERMITEMETELGRIRIVQIAGAVARRIMSYLVQGETIEKGERIGIIKLGSRVDLWLPEGKVKITVSLGQKVRAGESTIAEMLK